MENRGRINSILAIAFIVLSGVFIFCLGSQFYNGRQIVSIVSLDTIITLMASVAPYATMAFVVITAIILLGNGSRNTAISMSIFGILVIACQFAFSKFINNYGFADKINTETVHQMSLINVQVGIIGSYLIQPIVMLIILTSISLAAVIILLVDRIPSKMDAASQITAPVSANDPDIKEAADTSTAENEAEVDGQETETAENKTKENQVATGGGL